MKHNEVSAKLTRRDLIILILLAAAVWFLVASSFGFLSVGFDNIYIYAGNDDLSFTASIKKLIQQNWIWYSARLGAPYGEEALLFPVGCLHNVEYLLLKFWTFFTKDIPTVINLQLCLTFVLCAVSAYLVLRKMGTGTFLAAFGAVLFSFSPYIYGRSTAYSAHYSLAACYFIPLSVYLCRCCFFDDDFLKFDKHFICKKNFLVLVMCFLIANNGIAYYQFFTCFLLGVTGLCKYLSTKKFRAFLPALKTIALICLIMLAALLPVFLYQMRTESAVISDRNPHDLEYYSLKITQLFVPLFSHGISAVQNFMDVYNKNMPAVNENKNAYLGVIAGIGFLISILTFFIPHERKSEDEDIVLFSKLNLASVLFMTMGGMMTFAAVLLKIYSIRSLNRISIFIMFISLAVICLLLQRYVLNNAEMSSSKIKRAVVYAFLSLLMLFGVWEQTPQLFSDGADLLTNQIQWESDKRFVSGIESMLQPGDMVYQMPYHEYPEGRNINQMGPYHLLVGFIHSENLKWSFGGVTGSKAGDWYAYMNRISTSVQKLVENVSSFGFKGIYIDSRAYEQDEMTGLLQEFEEVLGYQPIVSEDGNLYFYSLYPYLDKQ